MARTLLRNVGRLVGAVLAVWGLLLVVDGLLGSTGGTDNQPSFTIAVGVVYLGLAGIVFAITEHGQWRGRGRSMRG